MINKKLRNIRLEPQETIFNRPTPRNTKDKEYLSSLNFKSMLTPLLSTKQHFLEQKDLVYYVIEFNQLYNTTDAAKTLKFLGAKIKNIIDPYNVYVCSEIKKIEEILDKDEVNKYSRGVVKKISFIDSNLKIGPQLVNKIKEKETSTFEEVTLVINENITLNEFEDFLLNLEKNNKGVNITRRYPEIRMASAHLKIQYLNNIKELSEIERIFLKPMVAEVCGESYEDKIILKREALSFRSPSNRLVKICVIDTGINFSKLSLIGVDEDNVGHGTKVASLACYSEQLLKKENVLIPETKIISHNLIQNGEYDLIKGIIDAIDENKKFCKIFCISQNFFSIDPLFRKVISERIDRFIQQQNVIVINSAGNIDWEDVEINKLDYPAYVSKFDVLCPSECRSIISVGNLSMDNQERLPACNTRYGISEIFVNKARDIFLYQKPEIFFQGGDVDLNTVKRKEGMISYDISDGKALPVINKNGDVALDVGTSFSAPLIANAFSRLLREYRDEYKNVETYKAMLFNKCDYNLIKENEEHQSRSIFSLKSLDGLEYCNDSIYLQFEGIWSPTEQFKYRDKKPFVKGYEVKFYVPKEIYKMRIFISHSNDYSLQSIDEPAVSFVPKVLKPNGKTVRSKYNTMAKPTHLHHGIYNLRESDCDGFWTVQFKLWGYKIPKEELDKVNVRFGISIRLFPKDNTDLERIYYLVKNGGMLEVEEHEISEEVIEITSSDKGEITA